MSVQPVNFAPVEHIEIRDGQARLTGRVTKVKMVISRMIHGQCTIEEIMEQYGLSRAEVYACMAYYYDHKEAIDRHFNQQQQVVSEHARPLSSLLSRRRSNEAISEDES